MRMRFRSKLEAFGRKESSRSRHRNGKIVAQIHFLVSTTIYCTKVASDAEILCVQGSKSVGKFLFVQNLSRIESRCTYL